MAQRKPPVPKSAKPFISEVASQSQSPASELVEQATADSPQTTGAPTPKAVIRQQAAQRPSKAKAQSSKQRLQDSLRRASAAALPARTSTKAGAVKAEATDTPATEPQAARFFSGRLTVLLGVIVLVAVIVTPSLNLFMQQQNEIAAVKADIAAKQREQAQLNKDLSRWNDPAYVKQQARERVNMVMPGETSFWVYGSNPAPTQPAQTPTSVNPAGLPWAEGLAQSVVRAGTQ